MKKNYIYVLVGVITLLLLGVAVFVSQNKNIEMGEEKAKETKITILVPNDLAAYEKAMNTYTSDGGENPSIRWSFVKQTMTIPYTADVMKASAEAAAEVISTQGGPAHASIAYLKIKDSTAYVLLNIDLDGWAGVTFSTNLIHPLVEKTLLQFPEIQKVKFGPAAGEVINPGENVKSIYSKADLEEMIATVEYGSKVFPDYCDNRKPVTIESVTYFDFDKDGIEEAIVRAYSCSTGTAGADINTVYKLLPNGTLVELKQKRDEYDDSWKNYGLSVKDGILIQTLPIYKEGDANCCPTGGLREISYTFNGTSFVAKSVKVMPDVPAFRKVN